MNELNKLLGSLLLLGGGFVAASLVGPPELADRLSQFLKPAQVADAEGLRPLPAGVATTAGDGWPQRSEASAFDTPPPSFAASPAEPAATGFLPLTDQQPITRAIPSAWPETATESAGVVQSAAPPAPNQDWLTGATFDRDLPAKREPTPERTTVSQMTAAPARPLTPVARRQATVAAAPSVSTGWPELRAPLPPQLAETQPEEREFQAPSNRRTAGKPSLEASPYGGRPRFEAFATAPEHDTADAPNPLRVSRPDVASQPVRRTPIAKHYERHVVTDGDTLASLADRYLGDAGRARELFELNRDRLDHPDVLPIGMVLKTPDNRGHRQSSQPPAVAAPIDAFPPIPTSSAFSTVAATENSVRGFARDVVQGLQRPMTTIGAPQEQPFTESERLGPVDPLYNREVSWDANRW